MGGLFMRTKRLFIGMFLLLILGLFLSSCVDAIELTVQFDSNGGSTVSSVVLDGSSQVSIPDNPTKEGYTFVGWYQEIDLINIYDFETIPTVDITLYAKWNINQYTIHFDSNDGTEVLDITQNYLTIVTAPDDPIKDGYIFDGWYIDEELIVEYTFTIVLTENINLYAKWIEDDGMIHLPNLTIYFSPSRDNESLLQSMNYLPDLLKIEMATLGYYIEVITVNLGVTYEAVGEALATGTADVGFITGNTYASFSNGVNMDAALTATRTGLSKDSTNPMDWNDGEPTVSDITCQLPYYRSIGIVGQTAKGRELADIINSGGTITWEDLQDAKIGVQSVTSNAGRVYPSLLFNDLYGHTLEDLPAANIIIVSGYGGAASALASGSVDIAFGYADFRRDYADEWISSIEGGYNQENTIWEDTDVIFVTDGVYNDTITVSKVTVDDALQAAIEQAFVNLIQDTTPLSNPSGIFQMVKDIFKVYSYEGFAIADDSDYDVTRAALELLNG